MRLASFISANLEPILEGWVDFARNQFPAAASMDETALLDHGKLILQDIAVNMNRPEDDDERQTKSEGRSTEASASKDVASRIHARQRERQGFEVDQLVAEYRALRATVMRLWSASPRESREQDLEDVIRFDEAVDQAIAESLKAFVVEVDKTRDLFLGVLGHDLRGPLSTIAACAQLDARTRPEDATRAGMVLRSVAQMRALLDDLVEYTRRRLGGELEVDPTNVQLDEFIRQTLDEIAAISPGRPLGFDAAGAMEGAWDARRLHQALSNLVFNALKYSPAGSPVQIALDGTQADEIALTVTNTGRPISPLLLPRLFDPLVRADGDAEDSTQSQVAGANLGLGLYVVREIAIAHGGSVSVTSDSTATRFELRLPRVCKRTVSQAR